MTPEIKAVVWPRNKTEGFYRYAVVGIVVTDKPIARYQQKNPLGITEWVIEGRLHENFLELPNLILRAPRLSTGDAISVLCSLHML